MPMQMVTRCMPTTWVLARAKMAEKIRSIPIHPRRQITKAGSMDILIAKRDSSSDIEQPHSSAWSEISCVDADGSAVSVISETMADTSARLPRYLLKGKDGRWVEELVAQPDGTLMDKRGRTFQPI